MRFWCVVMLSYQAAAAGWGDGATITVRAELAREVDRAMELERRGNYKEAERILLAAARAEERAGSGSIELAFILNDLGVLYTKVGRYGDAEQHLKRAIRILKALPGDDNEQFLANATLDLAVVYLDSNRGREAEKLDLFRLLAILRQPGDQVRAKTMIAALASSRGDLVEAERLYREVLAYWSEPVRAERHGPAIATMMNNLGVLALWQGRMEAARDWLERSLEMWRTLEGPAGPARVKAMANVATAYMRAKHYDEAVLWLERAVAAGQTTFGELHPLTVHMQQCYAEALKKAGRTTAAREAARTAAEARAMMRSSTTAYTVDYRDLGGLW